MAIKIQTFENITPLIIKRAATVQDLKDKIFEVKFIYILCLISKFTEIIIANLL